MASTYVVSSLTCLGALSATSVTVASITASGTIDGTIITASTNLAGPFVKTTATAGTLTGPGSYMSWNDDAGSGRTFFKNNKQGGAGGFTWSTYTNSNVLVSGSEAVLDVAGVMTCSGHKSWADAAVGGPGALMTWADAPTGKTYYKNQRSTGTGGWVWEGYNSSNASEGVALTLSHAGALVATAGITSTSLSATTLGLSGAATITSVSCTTITATTIGGTVITASTNLAAPFVKTTATAGTLTGPGSYMSWNDDAGSGRTFFKNNKQAGAGGFFWSTYTNANVLVSGSEAVLDVTGVMTCSGHKSWADAAVGGPGALMTWADAPTGKTYYKNQRSTGTGGWVWEGYNSSNASEGVALTLSHSGALFSASLVTATSTQSLGDQVVSGQGTYVTWNNGGDGTAYLKCQQGGGSAGGFKFQTYNSSDVLLAGTVSISNAGILDVPGITSGTFTPSFYYISGGNNREIGVTNPGSSRTGTITGTYKTLGNIVFVYVDMNFSDVYDSAGAIESTAWIGGMPTLGKTVLGGSMGSVSIDPGLQSWPGITNPNHIITSSRDTQQGITGTQGGVCFYADSTVLKILTIAVNVPMKLRFSMSYMLF